MKMLVGLIALLGCLNANAQLLPKASTNDFVAPVIYDKANLTAPLVGLIILDSSDGMFYGRDASNGWKLLSHVTDYVESKNGAFTDFDSYSGCAASTWCDLGSISLPAGEWDITAQTIYKS